MLESISKSLSIDPLVMLLNGVTFIVLLAVMDRVFWKPVMRHLDRRNEQIKDAYGTIEATRTEMDRLRTEYQQRLEEIEAQARARIQETLKAAQQSREQALAEAREAAERIAREGAEQIEADRLAARAAAEERLERAAMDALARAQGIAPDEAQQRLIQEYIVVRDRRN